MCGWPLPPPGDRYYFTLGAFDELKSKERFCTSECAMVEREHVVKELAEGLVTLEEVVEFKRADR